MKFGKQYNQSADETSTTSYLKFLKDGDTTFRIVQEPADWVEYWEHFNPGGYPFPCTNDRQNCPGCTSDNDRMKKPSKKIAMQVLEGEYVNVYKIPKTLADKISNRAERAKPTPTIVDRDYTISRYSSKTPDGMTRVDYDLEGGEKVPVDISKLQFKDVEQMLFDAYEQAWGDSARAQSTRDNAKYSDEEAALRAKLKAQVDAQEDEPPFDSTSAKTGGNYKELELRTMEPDRLWEIVKEEGLRRPRGWSELETDEIVNWLMKQVSDD